MAHASKSTSFLQRLDVAIDAVAQQFERRTVVSLPLKVSHIKASNAHKLEICRGDLSDESYQLILTMLNDDWNRPLRQNCGKLTHYCVPGCCASDKACQTKIKAALRASVGSFFDVPLLYRWKHFDPAAQFVLRNIIIHNVMSFVWEASMNKCFDDANVDLAAFVDADSADLAPAMKQKIRVGKVWTMLSEGNMLVTHLLIQKSELFYMSSNKCTLSVFDSLFNLFVCS